MHSFLQGQHLSLRVQALQQTCKSAIKDFCTVKAAPKKAVAVPSVKMKVKFAIAATATWKSCFTFVAIHVGKTTEQTCGTTVLW